MPLINYLADFFNHMHKNTDKKSSKKIPSVEIINHDFQFSSSQQSFLK